MGERHRSGEFAPQPHWIQIVVHHEGLRARSNRCALRKGVGMSTNDTPRNSADDEALRQEIQAAIKAGRELDPEMDSHLADSVLDRYRQEQSARNKALGRPQTPAAPQVANTPGMPGRPRDRKS